MKRRTFLVFLSLGIVVVLSKIFGVKILDLLDFLEPSDRRKIIHKITTNYNYLRRHGFKYVPLAIDYEKTKEIIQELFDGNVTDIKFQGHEVIVRLKTDDKRLMFYYSLVVICNLLTKLNTNQLKNTQYYNVLTGKSSEISIEVRLPLVLHTDYFQTPQELKNSKIGTSLDYALFFYDLLKDQEHKFFIVKCKDKYLLAISKKDYNNIDEMMEDFFNGKLLVFGCIGKFNTTPEKMFCEAFDLFENKPDVVIGLDRIIENKEPCGPMPNESIGIEMLGDFGKLVDLLSKTLGLNIERETIEDAIKAYKEFQRRVYKKYMEKCCEIEQELFKSIQEEMKTLSKIKVKINV